MSDRTPCPYCREAVAAEASVCSHCTREIALLRAAHAEIERLKARLAAAEAAAPAPAGAAVTSTPGGALALTSVVTSAPAAALPWRSAAYALLWVFYLVPAVLDYGVHQSDAAFYATFALAALTGAALALYARINVWLVLLLAFLQPYLPLPVLMLAGKVSWSMFPDFRAYAVEIALVASFAAIGSVAAFARGRLGPMFHLSSMFHWEVTAQWMESTRTRFELIQKFVVAALGVGGVLLTVIDGVARLVAHSP